MALDENLGKDSIERIVLDAIRTMNLGRNAEHQLEVSPTAPLYSRNCSLDSLGLVALIMEVEESLRDAGYEVSLSDKRAMSLLHNPFRDVPSLVDYIHNILAVPSP
jgi:acyl carrier protein